MSDITETPPAEMACNELVEVVTEYLEQTLADAERELMEKHLGECPWCERYVEQTRQVISALGRLGGEPVDPELCEQATAAFREQQRR